MQQTPWWKKSVVYQIYPRSFMDANGDGVGDLAGITSRLDYLQELGVDVLWLSPVYKSPNDDNGYDISDYRAIMAEFGTMADFDAMLAQAHRRGLKIVMDLVVNHTSDEHAWFVESRKARDNPYRDYYIWHDPVEGHAPTPVQSCFSGSAWQYSPETGQYYLHMFSKKQPDLNWDNPKVRGEVFDMMNWWCQKGIDGFRMDVISMISKPSAFFLPENGQYDTTNGPHVHEYLQQMNREVLSKYDLMTVGETPGVTVEEAQKYAGNDTRELNMVFQFELMDVDAGKYGKWGDGTFRLSDVKRIFSKWQDGLHGTAWNSLFWDNHDQPRCVSRFGCTDTPTLRVRSAKMLATCLHFQQGTPYIYQGEELGMTNYPFTSLTECRDIEAINAYHELVDEKGEIAPEDMMRYIRRSSRDNARTPMQWNSSKNAGFSTGEPWIPVNPNYTEINAEAALADPDSVFHYYQQLIRLRHELPVITNGTYTLLGPENEQLYCYIREDETQALLVLCSFSKGTTEFAVPERFGGSSLLLSNCKEPELLGATVTLQPFEARVYSLQK